MNNMRFRQEQDRRAQERQASRQPSQPPPQQQQQAPPPPPQQPMGQAIPLNRAGGESYDQGQQMTMEDAIRIAAQYGAVPSRISSGTADPSNGYMGVWAIPTAQGWVPLGGSGAPSAPPPSAPPTAQSTSDRARGPYGPGATPSAMTPAPAPSLPPRPAGAAQGPPTQAGQYPQPGPQGQGASLAPNVNVVVNNTPQPHEGEGAMAFQRRAASPGVPPAAAPGPALGAMSNPDYPYAPSWQGDQYGPSGLAQSAFDRSQRLDRPLPPTQDYLGINTGTRTPLLGGNQTPLNPESGFGSSLTQPLNRRSGFR